MAIAGIGVAAKVSMIVNLFRYGIAYIPALFILGWIFGVSGLVWAYPVADIITCIVAVLFYRATFLK